MKKLLKVSLVAMLVASPMVASAVTAPIAYAGGATVTDGVLSAPTASADVASTSYVKGAYNELAQAINGIATTAGNAADQDLSNISATGEGVIDTRAVNKINAAAGDGLSASNGVLSVDVDNSTIEVDGTSGKVQVKAGSISATQLNTAVNTSLGLADTALQAGTAASTGTVDLTKSDYTAGTIGAALYSINQTAGNGQTAQQVEDKIDAAAGDGLATDGSGVLSVDVDNSTIEVDGTSGKVQVKAGSISATQLNTAVNTSLGLADTALQNDSALNGANLTAGTVAETALDTATQTKLNNAAAAKYVTVHTTWGSDSTTSANVLTTTAPASGS